MGHLLLPVESPTSLSGPIHVLLQPGSVAADWRRAPPSPDCQALGSPRGAGQERPVDVEMTASVPEWAIGAVIGEGGRNLAAIERMSGAHVTCRCETFLSLQVKSLRWSHQVRLLMAGTSTRCTRDAQEGEEAQEGKESTSNTLRSLKSEAHAKPMHERSLCWESFWGTANP